MKEVKIPGSKFMLSLEDDENQWFLRLRINNAVEEEIPLTHLEKKALKSNIKELLNTAYVNLTDLQIDMIQKEIWGFIQKKLDKEKKGKKRRFGTIEDPRYDELVERLDNLASSIENLKEQISEKEELLT